MSIISEKVESQHAFFATRQTINVTYRKKILEAILNMLMKHQHEFEQALYADFKKPEFESFVSETGYLIKETRKALSSVMFWSQAERVSGSILSFPSSNYIVRKPFGVILIIAPWNYPLQLALSPLIGAIAAGNCCVIKPSEHAPKTSSLIAKYIDEYIDPEVVTVIEGGKRTSEALLKEKFDHIFFTGSTEIGRIVGIEAAKQLTPFTLELGGKSPVLVDETANVKIAARKIVHGKFFNCGQSCIAPDYVLVDKKISPFFINAVKTEIEKRFGKNPQESPDYARIINLQHLNRLKGYLENQRVHFGGKIDESNLFLSPTIILNPPKSTELMQKEIFGPILPILEVNNILEGMDYIKEYEKPLAFYLFTSNKQSIRRVTNELLFGGGCVNETLEHFINPNLPFGGIGNSGIGSYHGRFSFDLFSHKQSMLIKKSWFDFPLKYPPYSNKIKFIRKLFNLT